MFFLCWDTQMVFVFLMEYHNDSFGMLAQPCTLGINLLCHDV
jgi:hypothetical protein